MHLVLKWLTMGWLGQTLQKGPLWVLVCFFSTLASTHKTTGLIRRDGLIDYFCLQDNFLIVVEALQRAFCYDFLFSGFFIDI